MKTVVAEVEAEAEEVVDDDDDSSSSSSSVWSDAHIESQFKDFYQAKRFILDRVHGYIELSPVIAMLMDTPEFQRLRSLMQLGTSYWIFPGACHKRFEHSIGVMHLAGKMMRKLAENQPSLSITPREIFIVQAGA